MKEGVIQNDNIKPDIDEFVEEALGKVKAVLSSIGGPEGKIAVAAIDSVELLLSDELSDAITERVEEIPGTVEKLTGGWISKQVVKDAIYSIVGNEKIVQTIDSVIESVTDLINKYIITPIQQGIDITLEAIENMLGKLGKIVEPLIDMIEQVRQGVDNSLDHLKGRISNIDEEVEEAITEVKGDFEKQKSEISKTAMAKLDGISNTVQAIQMAAHQAERRVQEGPDKAPAKINEVLKQEAVEILKKSGVVAIETDHGTVLGGKQAQEEIASRQSVIKAQERAEQAAGVAGPGK